MFLFQWLIHLLSSECDHNFIVFNLFALVFGLLARFVFVLFKVVFVTLHPSGKLHPLGSSGPLSLRLCALCVYAWRWTSRHVCCFLTVQFWFWLVLLQFWRRPSSVLAILAADWLSLTLAGSTLSALLTVGGKALNECFTGTQLDSENNRETHEARVEYQRNNKVFLTFRTSTLTFWKWRLLSSLLRVWTSSYFSSASFL